MHIPKIQGPDPRNRRVAALIFDSLKLQPIACNNWPEQYPYTPKIQFRIFHTGAYLMLRFEVEEQYTAARVAADNGEVWTDSCVEFFISPDQGGYYNFECSCIGRLLVGFQKARGVETERAPQEIMASVLRFPSLGTEPFAECEGDNRWSLTLAIPPRALFKHTFTEWSGLTASANLYKCGDGLSHPHFLSWKPIETPKPDFHRPEFFEQIHFNAI